MAELAKVAIQSALTISAWYESTLKCVNRSACAALESAWMLLSKSFRSSSIVQVVMARIVRMFF